MTKFAEFSKGEIEAAKSWPAVSRYLEIVRRSAAAVEALPTGSTDRKVIELKIRRHTVWLECAISLFHNKHSDADVCLYWSQAAERHIRDAYELSGLSASGVAIFALGKLGAEELNLSSDVDLMLIDSDGNTTPRREAQEFLRILNHADEWGFCHRVDLALRPGGSAAALIPSLSQFENHYGYHGETWERLAFVRFRHIVGGDATLKDQVNSFARGFSYRRHLDYSIIDELRFLIHRIRSENAPGTSGEYHLKLHPGGIRDIELFVHALQTIHGGRRKVLQTHRTSEALLRLGEAGLLTEADARFLDVTYWHYRNLENRLQAENDEQTYKLTKPSLVDDVLQRAKRVIEISETLFPQVTAVDIPTAEDLASRGFTESRARDSLREIFETRVLSKKSERDQREKNIFLSGFLKSLEASSGDLDLGLGLLVDFIKTTRAKATLFSMLNREPILIHQLATLFGVSPWAGQILCSRPELLDAFILRQEATDVLTLDTDQALDALSERRMLGEIISILHFLESKDLESCVQNLTQLADSIATDLMRVTAKEIECEPIGIVALGKWGGRELGLRSDLDFVFVTATAPSNGQHRLARRFLNRMTGSHRGGSIYSVDLRLRPSGHAGPILIHIDQLIEHLKGSAAAWERQSWLRARSIDTLPHRLGNDVIATILDRGLTKQEDLELAEIALKLFKPIPMDMTKGLVDLKLVHGGLAPIEFAAQIEVLRSGPTTRPHNRNLLETSTRGMFHFLEGFEATTSPRKALLDSLQATHLWLRRSEQWVRVTGDVSGSALSLGSKDFLRFAKTSGEAADKFPEILRTKLIESSENLKTLLGR